MEAMAQLRLGREGKTESSRIFKTDIISPPQLKHYILTISKMKQKSVWLLGVGSGASQDECAHLQKIPAVWMSEVAGMSSPTRAGAATRDLRSPATRQTLRACGSVRGEPARAPAPERPLNPRHGARARAAPASPGSPRDAPGSATRLTARNRPATRRGHRHPRLANRPSFHNARYDVRKQLFPFCQAADGKNPLGGCRFPPLPPVTRHRLSQVPPRRGSEGTMPGTP